jgi:rare lipoprotein A
MIRASIANLCLLAVMLADGLVVGATGMRPALPPLRGSIGFASLPPPLAMPAIEEALSVPLRADDDDQIGMASWYGEHWQGRVTASGKPFDMSKLTAAHRTLPLNTKVRVKNLQTGKSVEVTINDRGPYINGRTIDLSKAAARLLGMVKEGLAPVEITTIELPTLPSSASSPKIASAD